MILPITNQPIAFNLDTAEKCNTKYFLPVLKGTDSFTLQGFSTQTGHLNLVDPAGWTLGANFSVSAGNVSYAGSFSSSTATSNALGLRPGCLYEILLTVTIVATNGAATGQGVVLSINGQNIPLPGGLPGSNQSFKLSWYYSPGSISTDQLEITTNFSLIQFTVLNIEVVQYSVPALLAYNVNDNYLEQLLAAVHYFNQPNFTAINSTQCRFEIAFDLDTLNEGCYYLQLTDTGAGANTFNPTGWTAATGWTFNADGAIYTDDGLFNELQQTVLLMGGEQYSFQYNFNTAGLVFNLKVYFASGNISQPVVSADGTYVYTFTVPGTGMQPVVLSLLPGIPLGLTSGQIAALLGHQLSVSNGILTYGVPQNNLRSNNMNLHNAQMQTILFTATNNDNAFNFDYSNSLTHKLRVNAKMKYHDYQETVEEYNFSDNSNILMSASIEKSFEIIVADAAEFVHDCLSMMRINDNFNINSLPYMRDGNYAIKQRKSTELSSAAFSVKPVLGIGKNWPIG